MTLLEKLRTKFCGITPETIPELIKSEDSESIYIAGWVSGILEVIDFISSLSDTIVTLPFTIGDKVFIIINNREYGKSDCPACGGINSRILQDGKKYACCICQGYGQVNSQYDNYRVVQAIVTYIDVSKNKNNVVSYKIQLTDKDSQTLPTMYELKDIYLSEEDVIKKATELNSKKPKNTLEPIEF